MKEELTGEDIFWVENKKYFIGINRDTNKVEIFDENKDLVKSIELDGE